MPTFILALIAVLLSGAPARADDFCSAFPRLESLAAQRCANFDQFPDSEVKAARNGCVAFYETVRKSAKSFCAFSKAVDQLDAQNRAAPAQAEARTHMFYQRWATQLAAGPRRDLELALIRYQDKLAKLNDFGLGLLREEATSCGRQGSAPSPAYLGLALTAGYEAAHTHRWLSDIFVGLAVAMQKQADLRPQLQDRPEGQPGPAPTPRAPEGPEQTHAAEPAVKGLISEAISQILQLHGLQGLGVDLVDKLLIAQKMDVLDLIVIASKAIVITAGGTSAGPTVGISLGIAMAINGAIDYLEFAIRSVHGSFERLANARMEEVLNFHQCKLRRNSSLSSDALARALHQWRRDGICGAPCANPGLFGVCRGSLVFSADRCE